MSGALPFPVEGADFIATARFITATAARIRALRAEQRHEGARGAAAGLRRLAATIRAAQAVHGFMADLVLGDSLAEAESVCAEILPEGDFSA